MLVTRKKFEDVVADLKKPDFYGVDTETTGLSTFKGDEPFSLIIAKTDGSYYYFNFNPDIFVDHDCEGSELYALDESEILDQSHWNKLQEVFHVEQSYLCMANAKFDMHMLRKVGIEITSKIHCTQAMERVVNNLTMGLGLDSCAKRRGWAKDDKVKAYISKHKLYTSYTPPGANKAKKNLHFNKVALNVIVPYGGVDAVLALNVALDQLKDLQSQRENWPNDLNSPWDIHLNEIKVTKALFEMEHVGMLVDFDYCKKAVVHYEKQIEKAEGDFFELTGEDFVDSAKCLVPIFDKMCLPYPKTAKGNPSFNEESLRKLDHELIDAIFKIKKAQKKCNTYFRNFMYFADPQGYIHPSLVQEGAKTARMSCREPNLQNVPSRGEEKIAFPTRRAFIAPEGFDIVAIDYDQVEYRVMLDYAGQMDIINKVLEGMDVHQVMGDKVGVSRSDAKTLNFSIIYGTGKDALAKGLGVTPDEAKITKANFFAGLPKVQDFIYRVKNRAKASGHIFNGMGRKNNLPIVPGRDMSYVMPNHLIQGFCADLIKKALWKCIDYLELNNAKSKCVMVVHDELIFYIHKSEHALIKPLKEIMEGVYNYRHLPLTCSVEISETSWHDKREIEV